jgi:hypothetical protein
MKLSSKERISLLNQYRILAKLYPDEEAHYQELVSILESGYEVFYSQIDQWLSDPMPEEEGRFVIDVLNMYRAIEDFKRSNESDAVSTDFLSFFRGFDGNEEASYMSFAKFLILDQGKFAEQRNYFSKNDALNSHAPMIGKYRRMVQRWQETTAQWNLSERDVLAILGAARS